MLVTTSLNHHENKRKMYSERQGRGSYTGYVLEGKVSATLVYCCVLEPVKDI
jgi:hypothetical protein